MGHNSVVSGQPKSTGILRVNWLSTGPPGFWASQSVPEVDMILDKIEQFQRFLARHKRIKNKEAHYAL